jgi:hypothetical protein
MAWRSFFVLREGEYRRDHPIGAGKERWRDVHTQRLGGLKIEDELEPGYPLDRQVLGLLAAQKSIRKGREPSPCRAPRSLLGMERRQRNIP